MRNLDVLESSSKPNSTDGTLLELLDSCCTAFGMVSVFWKHRRIDGTSCFRKAPAAILALQSVMQRGSDQGTTRSHRSFDRRKGFHRESERRVEANARFGTATSKVSAITLRCFEGILDHDLWDRVHTMGTKKRLDHPDSRAVFFEAEKYNKVWNEIGLCGRWCIETGCCF